MSHYQRCDNCGIEFESRTDTLYCKDCVLELNSKPVVSFGSSYCGSCGAELGSDTDSSLCTACRNERISEPQPPPLPPQDSIYHRICDSCGAAFETGGPTMICDACLVRASMSHESPEIYKHWEEFDVIPQVRPWIRFWARLIDVTAGMATGSMLILFVLSASVPLVIAGYLDAEPMAEFAEFLQKDFASTVLWFPFFLPFIIIVEALLLSTTGTTLGKWAFNISVRDSITGKKLSFIKSLTRSVHVWLKGCALGFPAVHLITWLLSYRYLTLNQITSWDRDLEVSTQHSSINDLKAVFAVFLVVSPFLLDFL